MVQIGYLLTTGMYDDYRVHAVFLDSADAQAVADQYNSSIDSPNENNQAEIEEIQIYDSDQQPTLVYNNYIGGPSFQTDEEYLAK